MTVKFIPTSEYEKILFLPYSAIFCGSGLYFMKGDVECGDDDIKRIIGFSMLS
jgi:hypothetical protein